MQKDADANFALKTLMFFRPLVNLIEPIQIFLKTMYLL